jgi:hypothetical protein
MKSGLGALPSQLGSFNHQRRNRIIYHAPRTLGFFVLCQLNPEVLACYDVYVRRLVGFAEGFLQNLPCGSAFAFS